LARRKHYGFERRQKEATRRTQQEAKKQRKADRAATGEVGPEMGDPQETGLPAGQWEWFSPSRGRVMTTEAGHRPEAEGPDDWTLLTEPDEEPPAGAEAGTAGA
jgi:hypothetical protein